MLFDIPTLLQRDKRRVEGLLPDATEEQRASAWQLGASAGTGRPVHGGWWSTGNVRTDGVSLGLCILRGRPKGAQQLVAPVPIMDPPNSFSKLIYWMGSRCCIRTQWQLRSIQGS
jgi:hypothetical protein